MCTSLAPEIGYEAAARIAKESYRTGMTVRQIARRQEILPEDQLNELLDPWKMTGPNKKSRGRPGTMLGILPSAARASLATAAGSISGTKAERFSATVSRRYLGVRVAPARQVSTSIPRSLSSPQRPSANTRFQALVAP